MKSSYNPAVSPLTHRASTYDALGNIISETTPSWSYSYDAENRLISATGANAESYVYDAIGRRVKLINNGGVRLYFYDLGGHAMTATDPGGNRYRSEIYLGEMHLATYANSKTYFSHTNLLGTTRVITDETGAVNNNCTYWPFGDWQSCSNGTPITPIGYAGYEHDPETGLDHMWFRYYNPRIGRFMSADPLGGSIGDPQSLNRFAYVENNVPNAIDPLGLFCPGDGCVGGVGGGGGSGVGGSGGGYGESPGSGQDCDVPGLANALLQSGWDIWAMPFAACPSRGGGRERLRNGAWRGDPQHHRGVTGNNAAPPVLGGTPADNLIEEQNDEFNTCLEEKSFEAAGKAGKEMLSKSTHTEEGGGNPLEPELTVVGAALDVHKECLAEFPLSVLSPNYKGAYYPGNPGVFPIFQFLTWSL